MFYRDFLKENGPMKTLALAYLRTSSATNVGGDSRPRQQDAIERYAKAAGFDIMASYFDAAVSGADRIDQRAGFADMLAHIAGNGARTIIVENASRFARDLIVQETGYAKLKEAGITLIAADDPDAFTADTPTARMVRQILGAVSEFEKANLVAKLRGARDRKSVAAGKRIEGRKGYGAQSDMIREAKRLARRSPKTGKGRSLREIAAQLATLGYCTSNGETFSASQVQRLIAK